MVAESRDADLEGLGSMSASDVARSTVRQLIELGVSDFVLSPGSRNAPLSLALYEASEKGLISLHVRIDERGAAYFALGLSKASKKYVAVVCTSGTAVANYHPAALEAYHSNNKLLFLTADRPARLRKTGANQTTLQDGVLAPLTTIDTDTRVDCSAHLTGGPVHLNIQFDEPLLEKNDSQDWLGGVHISAEANDEIPQGSLQLSARSVIVIGHDSAGLSPNVLNQIIATAGLPVIAEDPLSYPTAIPHAALFLSDEKIREKLKADHILVIGRTTLSRSINAYIGQSNNVVVVDPRAEKIDTARTASQILFAMPTISTASTDAQWIESWKTAGKEAASAITLQWSEQKVAQILAREIPAGSALFVGSSRPVRDLEAFGDPRGDLHIFANRGLAGIDGNTSTACGIAAFYERTYSILGDLTFLHDLSALAHASADNHTIFIVDNNGGGIFSTLPQAGSDGFEKVFGTPHHIDIEKVIQGFGYSVEKVKSESDLARSLHKSGLHFVVVEVPTREENAQTLKELHQRVASAVRMGSNFA